MRVARPVARCLFCSFSRTATTPALSRLSRRQFHSSPTQYNNNNNDDKKPKVPEETPPTPELNSWHDLTPSDLDHYSKQEKSRLREEYSAAQVAAIEAGEKSINPEDLENQCAERDDPWALEYLDDFSTIEPVIDHHKRAPMTNYDPNSRFKNEDEIVDDLAEYILKMPDDPTPADWLRFTDNMRLTVGKPEAELDPHSSLVPDIFEPGETLENIGEPNALPKRDPAMTAEGGGEIAPGLLRLMQVTGYSQKQIKGLKVKALVMHSVVNQTRLGKIRKTYVLSVAGNGNGLLGIGEGKSEEPSEARVQSQYRAIRNMQPILRYENRTIYGDIKGKVGAVELQMMHRPPGFGLRCQHNIWEMCRAAGIHDLAARVSRSRNPMNTVKAAYQALLSQKHPEDIARARGKKLVDVRKVYYAGNV
ncbi:28S ribosomal protein S5, mitochondrial [Emydomyces testavorans]|uniref:Small ribosomal subunit protein uS5m n=1 Tax=Emydomyces testavorans TaxID=2070801 RepID=A0AAF0ILN1_9EURO|nr:28S ribosomal protein S5, mitochondrial [Emydomyces testavorans]